jgi:hypothetical protein
MRITLNSLNRFISNPLVCDDTISVFFFVFVPYFFFIFPPEDGKTHQVGKFNKEDFTLAMEHNILRKKFYNTQPNFA